MHERMQMQARQAGLPENTPLVEQVAVHEDMGVPKTAMQIAASKYRRSGQGQGNEQAAPAAAEVYPEPKRRDQFVHFSVMPSALLALLVCWLSISFICP